MAKGMRATPNTKVQIQKYKYFDFSVEPKVKDCYTATMKNTEIQKYKYLDFSVEPEVKDC